MSARPTLSSLAAAMALVALASAARAAPPADATNVAPPPVAAADAPAPPPGVSEAPAAPRPASLDASRLQRPQTLLAPTPPRVPLARRWWFWAGLGAAAVGVILAAIYLRPRQPYSGNATPGLETLF